MSQLYTMEEALASPFRLPLGPSLEQNSRFNFAIFESGVFFLIVPVLGDIGEHAFGRFARARCFVGGHEVVRLAKFAVVFRLGDGVNIIHDIMGNNGIKRAGLIAEEEAGEVEGLFIKTPVVGVSVCHPVGLNVLRHDLASPAPRNFDRPSGLHFGGVERALLRVVGGSE